MPKKKEIIINKEHTLEDLTSVSKTIMPLAKQLLGAKGMLEMEILSDWTAIVGEELAQYSLPQKISFHKDERSNGTLELLVLSGAFALEIQHRESQILNKINAYFGYDAVAKLKIIQNSCPENFLFTKKPIDNVKKNLVSPEEHNYITEIIKDVDNNELRRHLEILGEAVLGSKKS
ncbi:MAG: DciA family protein [Alphaproteobacteria bacterium]|nr:DciA family protein [Alphaproteobacteria bacterium]